MMLTTDMASQQPGAQVRCQSNRPSRARTCSRGPDRGQKRVATQLLVRTSRQHHHPSISGAYTSPNMSSKYHLLTESEKKRIVCVWLNSDAGKVDWDRAASEFGGTGNVDTFRRAMRMTLQRINEGGEANASPATPVKKRKSNSKVSKSKRGRKQKQKQESESEADLEGLM